MSGRKCGGTVHTHTHTHTHTQAHAHAHTHIVNVCIREGTFFLESFCSHCARTLTFENCLSLSLSLARARARARARALSL